MNTISFMTANYVARQIGYNMTEGWMQGDKATNDYFRPLETFPARFDEYLADAKALGFEAMDIWIAILNPVWATDGHIRAAQDTLAKYELKVVSLAGGFGNNREEFEKTCRLAAALQTTVLGGGTSLLQSNRNSVISTLKDYGLKLGIENHPEKTPDELLAKIGDGGDGTIGAAVDTGWFGTHNYDAAKALEAIDDHLFHVHLKDVLAPGAHETCRFGWGCVPIEECVKTLQRIGYTGAISVEHEPDHYDPTADVKASLEMLKAWMGQS
jgi:sugar phosphate isomerase/epimerase